MSRTKRSVTHRLRFFTISFSIKSNDEAISKLVFSQKHSTEGWFKDFIMQIYNNYYCNIYLCLLFFVSVVYSNEELSEKSSVSKREAQRKRNENIPMMGTK